MSRVRWPRGIALVNASIAALAAVASAQPIAPGTLRPPLSPRNANYVIDARLDPASRTVTGSEIIVWRNISSRTAEDLQFHLYWNAWRDDRSTWLREAVLGGLSLRDRRGGDWSRIDLTSVRLIAITADDTALRAYATDLGAQSSDSDRTGGSIDLLERAHFIAPDDHNSEDKTVLAVPLPGAVAPGDSAIVAVKWTAHVPRTFARTGAIGNFFFIAQWFPKLGVLQDAGWNCHQFHAGTEFFSDYGSYNVSLTVPNGWVVGATGRRQGLRDNPDNTTTHRYYQDDVHDFAWTTSPDYVERTARFEHPPLPPVDMRLLLQPEHSGQAERHFDATRTALQYYGEWFGAYPYGHITIVDPAYQSGAGGMEYPTLFTAGTRWIAPGRVTMPEGVVVHEAGHQFWYGVVGSNEFEDALLDEGFNTFSTARAIAAAYDPNYLAIRYFGGFLPYVFKDVVLKRETDGNRWAQYRTAAKSDLTSGPSYSFFPSGQTRNAMTYAKTALWLNTLERRLGWPALQKIMSTYFSRWKFRHPRPTDFFETASSVAGTDLEWYFDQVYRSSNAFDYGIARLTSTPRDKGFHTSVVARRYGEGIFPVDVLVTFADGHRTVEHWAGQERWIAYEYDRPARAVSAEVDPDRVLLLDVNVTNNSKTLSPRGPAAATRWSARWMVWLQNMLLTWAALV